MGAVESDSAQLLHDKKHAQVPAATAAFCHCKSHAGNVAKSQIEPWQKDVRREAGKV
jgi:hypothetical protein